MNKPATNRPLWMLPLGRLHPAWWAPVAGVLVYIDYLTGPYVQVPAAYVLPVTLAAWYSGRATALTLAVIMPLTRVGLMLGPFGTPWDFTDTLVTAVVRVAMFVFLALVIDRLVQHEQALAREVQLLEGLLPICSFCRSIRTANDEWEAFESYVSRQTQFSHALCPACARKNFPEYFTPDGP